MASVQALELSVDSNNPSQDSSQPGDHVQSRYVTRWFKAFS